MNVVLEENVTRIFNHARLSRYEPLSLACCEQLGIGEIWIAGCEIMLKQNVCNPEIYASRDVNTLNHHYIHLYQKCWEKAMKMDTEYWTLYKNDASPIKMAQAQLLCDEYTKGNWYLFRTAIRFLTISKADYDCSGRTCVLKFTIGNFEDLYPEQC